MGSILPNHDAKVGIGQTEKRQKKRTKKTQDRLHQTQLEHKQYRK